MIAVLTVLWPFVLLYSNEWLTLKCINSSRQNAIIHGKSPSAITGDASAGMATVSQTGRRLIL
jgi:hypothetical protein